MSLVNVLTPPLGSSITALLGPTNTGKTHRCVGRMLEYDTGMLGLPLRLLAREVYDRVCAAVGRECVALVTGEERRVPSSARFWICTTEAMPTDLEVDFVGVDEIQLAGHPKRGHVFTERLLHARGRYETWFLGASTIAPVLRELVPTVQIRSAERLSRLSFVGDIRLGQLPPRSAVVAFSIPGVYALAERLRARHGGVAVVLGALSPRTRNAQVAMYQAGEVDHLVATDAIGMGLNMSIGHVSLSALHKFDGQHRRALSSSEIAQIAGRAGRSVHDGSFSTLSPLQLDANLAHSIVSHRFPALRHAVWRNVDLSFDSLDSLRSSLMAPPHHPRLKLVRQADDSTALELLWRNEAVRKRVRSLQQVRLLWEVCQIPDYRKLLPELHAQLVISIYTHLEATGCQLDDDWVAQQVEPLENVQGDLDTLLARIAFVRTWTYVSQRSSWVRQPKHWQERMRDLENRLSDALHERLITRFVQRTRNRQRSSERGRSGTAMRTRQADPFASHQPSAPSSADPGQALDPHHPFAALASIRAQLSPNQAADPLTPEQGLLDRPADAWELRADGIVRCGGCAVAKLRSGPSLFGPHVVLVYEGASGRTATLHERAQAAARQCISRLLQALEPPEQASPSLRGICYQLKSTLGTVRRDAVETLLDALPERDEQLLRARGVLVGQHWVFVRKLLTPSALEMRFALARAYFGPQALPLRPPTSQVSLPATNQLQEAANAVGFVPAGPLWIRCDAVERGAIALAGGAAPSHMCTILGCKRSQLGRVVGALSLKSQWNPSGARKSKRNAEFS